MKLSELKKHVETALNVGGDMDVYIVLFSEVKESKTYWCSLIMSSFSPEEKRFIIATNDKLIVGDKHG